MAEKNSMQSTKVVTGVVRLSYAKLFKPEANIGSSELKYSTSIIIPKSDTATLTRIKTAIDAAKEQGKSSKFGGKVPANLKIPVRDGDRERPDDEAYKNSYFLNCSSKTRPGLVDINLNPIIDETELYSGCYVRVSLNFFPFENSGNKGIACGLNNVQKVRDGDSLGGKVSAEVDFADGFNDISDDDLPFLV